MAEHSYSGELLLSSLNEYFDRRESDIVRGTITLKLQPRALEYLSSRLQILGELEALRQSSPAEFFRGAFTDLDDYTNLQKLQHVLQHAQSVRIQPSVSHLRDPTRVNLSAFHSLSRLELIGCDLSTSAWIGLKNVESVENLKCSGCLEELQHLLSPFSHHLSMPGGGMPTLWPNLTSLHCTRNTFERMDSSLNLPALRSLDLSNNNILTIQNLHTCSRLTSLNLSYNNIESLAPLRDCTTGLQQLILQGNAIRSMKGLQNLVSLTELDLRCNLLASYPELRSLKELTDLRYLWLEGNPLSYAPFYRLDVLAWFDVTHLCLDGVSPKSSESTAVAMRATGEVPLAWHIMAQYVSQQQLLWRPKEALPSRASLLWRTSSMGRQSKFSPHRSASIGRRSLHKRVPARRIVDFTGDPQAALQSALERPPSPSPFQPNRDDGTDTASRASSASGGRLPMLRAQERMTHATVHTTYRDCSTARERQRPVSADAKVPAYDRSVIDLAQEAIEPTLVRHEGGSDSESSSLDTASTNDPSLPASPISKPAPPMAA